MASLRHKSGTSNESRTLQAGLLKIPGNDDISLVLIKRHWLPVEKRIVLKIVLLTFNYLHSGLVPSFPNDLVVKKPISGASS